MTELAAQWTCRTVDPEGARGEAIEIKGTDPFQIWLSNLTSMDRLLLASHAAELAAQHLDGNGRGVIPERIIEVETASGPVRFRVRGRLVAEYRAEVMP